MTTVSNPTLPYAGRQVQRYNRTAMVLHWLVAALILINVFYGLAAKSADDSRVRALVDAHKSIGLTVLGLVLLRIFWRLAHRPPPLPRSYPWIERITAHGVHYALYAVMLLLPLSGYLHDSAWNGAAGHPLVWFGILNLPRMAIVKSLDPAVKDHLHDLFGAAHVYIGYVLYGLVALHLIGVAKHHAIDHEPELSRMLPAGYQRPDDAA